MFALAGFVFVLLVFGSAAVSAASRGLAPQHKVPIASIHTAVGLRGPAVQRQRPSPQRRPAAVDARALARGIHPPEPPAPDAPGPQPVAPAPAVPLPEPQPEAQPNPPWANSLPPLTHAVPIELESPPEQPAEAPPAEEPGPEAPPAEEPGPEAPPAEEPPHEEPPPPAEPPPPSGGQQLFSSDFSKALEGWSLAGVGEVIPQVVSSTEGPYCEFTLTGTQGRSELIMGNNLHIVEGETVLYEFEEFIVPGFAYGSRALGWNLFTQFKSDGEGSPMLALDLWDEGGKKGLWVESDPGPVYFVAPMAEGVWHRITMQITASASGAGGWILSLDGQEIDRKTGMSTIRPGKAFAYIKNGLYRSGSTINATSKLRLRNVVLTGVS